MLQSTLRHGAPPDCIGSIGLELALIPGSLKLHAAQEDSFSCFIITYFRNKHTKTDLMHCQMSTWNFRPRLVLAPFSIRLNILPGCLSQHALLGKFCVTTSFSSLASLLPTLEHFMKKAQSGRLSASAPMLMLLPCFPAGFVYIRSSPSYGELATGIIPKLIKEVY